MHSTLGTICFDVFGNDFKMFKLNSNPSKLRMCPTTLFLFDSQCCCGVALAHLVLCCVAVVQLLHTKINLIMQCGTVMDVCRWIPHKHHASNSLNRIEPNRAATLNRMNRTPNRNEPNRKLICINTHVHQCVLMCTNMH